MSAMEQDKYEGAKRNAQGWYESIKEMIGNLNAAEKLRIDPEHRDIGESGFEDARNAIDESPLEIAVRDGWHSPGQPQEDGPEEFYILLSTGGPALRIWGTLDKHDNPDECELQMQDWFLPWTKWVPEPYDEEYRDTLQAFASCFYFGD